MTERKLLLEYINGENPVSFDLLESSFSKIEFLGDDEINIFGGRHIMFKTENDDFLGLVGIHVFIKDENGRIISQYFKSFNTPSAKARIYKTQKERSFPIFEIEVKGY